MLGHLSCRPMYIRPGPKWTWRRVAIESIKSNTHTVRTIVSHAHCAGLNTMYTYISRGERALKRAPARREVRERAHNMHECTKSALLRLAKLTELLAVWQKSRDTAIAFQSVRNCVSRTTIHESANES